MKIRRRRSLIYLSLLLLLLFAGYLYLRPLLQAGSGYAAKMTCSCKYVQELPVTPDSIRSSRLNFNVLPHISLREDAANKSIRASFYGLAGREARYIPGRGCVLVSDDGRTMPAAFTFPPLQMVGSADEQLTPDSTTFAGVNTDALSTAIDYGMSPVAGGGALGIVVLRGGKLLDEQYAPGIDAATPLLGWSMTKSLTAALVGMRIADGAIDPDQKPVFPEWADKPDRPDPRAAISLDNLLRMNSGLRWEEAYGSLSDATVMLHHEADMAAYARKQPLAHPPGTLWAYSSGTTNILMSLVASTFPNQDAMLNWMYDSLFYAIGANSFLLETDQSGIPVGSSYGWATARDWGKLGQLFLQGGRWEDRQILPVGWVDYLRQPADGSEGTYGGQVWLKGPDMPSLPDDAFLFRGFQDQRVIMLPSQDIVIVRLGHNNDQTADFDGLVDRVLQAIE